MITNSSVIQKRIEKSNIKFISPDKVFQTDAGHISEGQTNRIPESKEKLFHPFGFEYQQYQQMFYRPTTGNLFVVIMLIPVKGTSDSELFRYGIQLREHPLNIWNRIIVQDDKQIENAPSGVLETHLRMKATSKLTLGVEDSDWGANGVYVQVGFCSQDRVSSIDHVSDLALAMYLLDDIVDRTQSINPDKHSDQLLQPQQFSRALQRVKHLFSFQGAIWNQELVELRNSWAIAARSILQGKDPITEVNRFKKLVEATSLNIHGYLKRQS